MNRLFCLLLLLLGLFPAAAAANVEIKNVAFADSYPTAKAELKLTGAALLKWAMLFDVYAGAFYLPESIPGDDWTKDVPKHLELSYFRNFKAGDFASSSDQLLRDNLPGEQYSSLAERLQNFYQLFVDIKPGDRYSLTYLPDIGTELRLNGQLLGIAIGHDFAIAYFGIWIGPSPISISFRDQLLGK